MAKQKTLIGKHVSAAGGLEKAPARAAAIGCECFQLFTRSPMGGQPKPIDKETQKLFSEECKKHKQANVYVHTPYFINFASTNKRIYKGSIEIVRSELERASQISAKAVMTHLGSAKDHDDETAAAKQVAQSIAAIVKGYKGSSQMLLEISAGSGKVIGDTFEEVATILKTPGVKNKNVGVCFDTAHAFASGYDLRTKKDVDDTFKKFDKAIGLKNLVLIHANDSRVDFDSHVDRHWHIGKGKIGLAGFKQIVVWAKKIGADLILETPEENMDKKNINVLKKLRNNI
tara:strand:- start:495 stop:1355 length:861 start_codon:yes stop_codon:yes gene_type:complete